MNNQEANIANYLRTLFARLITHWLRRPRALVVRKGMVLATSTDVSNNKRPNALHIRVLQSK